MSKLLIIAGPTATGKTALAIHLAKKFNGELVSADSRQVYKFMNFGTGKDLPENPQYFDQNSKFQNRNPDHSYGFYLFDNVPVWGLDVVAPDYFFSVSDFVDYCHAVIADIEKRGRLPIVVGGTGLYIRGVLGQIDTLGNAFDEKLRRDLEKLSIAELREKLENVDPVWLSEMNASDQKNPRRLVRAIEVAATEKKPTINFASDHFDTQVIVLNAPIDHILDKIKNRPRGAILSEVKGLLGRGYDFSLASMTGLGYKAFKRIAEKLIAGEESEKDVEDSLNLWNQEDRQYAKRQLTFLKKYFPEQFTNELKTIWVDITTKNYLEKIEDITHKWYTGSAIDEHK